MDHEVVRIEDAPPGRYDDEHLREVKRLRHALEGGSREPAVVISVPTQGQVNVVYPDDARQITIDWSEIESSSSLTLVQKLVEEIESLPGVDGSEGLKDILGDLKEKVIELKR